MTNDAIDLLPCPWCGDTPSALEWPAGNGKWYSIECVECALEFSSSDLECLSKQWNTRAAPQITPEVRFRMVHAAVAACDELAKLDGEDWVPTKYIGAAVDAVLATLNIRVGRE